MSVSIAVKLFIVISAAATGWTKTLNNFQKEEMNWRSLPDKILNLPTLDVMPQFDMFSGYLELSPTKALHYWLNECEDTTSNKLIIWFNGGPGCSSMDGLLMENGPFKFQDFSGKLVSNPHTWNKLAHTLYIESPAGVGFSYNNQEEDQINDDITAQDNLNALKQFFTKFPSYRDYDLYITGESYGGMYIPVLIGTMIEDKSWFVNNIKGVAIGNGLLNRRLNSNSLVYYAYYHGLFGPHMWRELHEYCCDQDGCDFNTFYNENCLLKVSQLNHVVSNDNLNIYNLYSDCASESENELLKRSSSRQIFFQSSPVITMDKSLTGNSLSLVPPCSNVSLITNYLNREDVQTAIHVRPKTWMICDDKIFNEYERQYQDMSGQIRNVLQSLEDIRILLYFGDFDMACNFIGGEQFVDQLGYEILTPRRKWFVEDNGSRQVAGFFKEYDRLAYVTVKGAGHMAPTDKPVQVYRMLERFMNEEPL